MSSAATKAATHYLQFDIQWSSIALLFYDYALTFPMEVKYIWGSKFQSSVILYIFCRYALLANVLYLLAIAGRLTTGCDTTYKLIGALSVLGRAAVIVTFTLRTYVIFARSRIILAYLSILGVACVALDIMHVPGLRCVGSSSIPIANELLSILMVVFEYSSAILTIVRSIQAFRAEGSPWKARKNGLVYLIFEQGVLYFSIVSLFTTAAVVLNFRAPSGFFQRLLNALTLPLSGLLTARFLLHLRKWKTDQNAELTLGLHSRSQGQSDTIGSFHAMAGAVASSIDEFGDDPVARVQNMAGAAGLSTNAQAGGSHFSSGGDQTSSSLGTETSTSHHNTIEMEGVLSGSVEFLGSVKEGKRPVQIV